MNKQQFMTTLSDMLCELPHADVGERLAFYSEMIDDRVEDGIPEDQAVAEIGAVEDIARQIAADVAHAADCEKDRDKKDEIKISEQKKTKEKSEEKGSSPRRMRAWEIVLLAVGAPIWLSLAAAAFAVMVALYAVLWSLIVSAWAIFAALVSCAPAGIVSGIVFICTSNVLSGVAMIACGAVCAGLAIFAFFGCVAATDGAAYLTKMIFVLIKKCFVGGGKKDE